MALNRRHFLAALPPLLGASIAFACGGGRSERPSAQPDLTSGAESGVGSAGANQDRAAATTTPILPATPACGDADDPTPAQTEGPYFTPNSPERASLLEPGMPGTRLVIEGIVQSRSCQPLTHALIDFWQCDNAGVYDNAGYRLRGHQFTDANGRYRLETIVPGLYTGRTRHIHVKVQAPSRPALTTQLYFPNEPANARDGIFNQALLLQDYRDAPGGKVGSFDFVLDLV